MTGIAPVALRTRRMMADSTSASSRLTTRSRSVSVLDGAICSSGTSSPVVGRRYCTRLWWESSVSSSMRTPVARRTSTVAQAQNARSSSMPRSRRLPVLGSSAQIVGAENPFISRGLGILLDQPAESIPPHDPFAGRWIGFADGSDRWRLTECAVRPVLVVVRHVARQHCFDMPPAQDQHPVEQLTTYRADPALGDRVGPRRQLRLIPLLGSGLSG